MQTTILTIDRAKFAPEQLDLAAQLIKSGGLVVFPTETVYGLGADATSPTAAARIYAAKGRPSDNPLIVHIADATDIDRIAKNIPSYVRTIVAAFWPGPLTVILEKNDIIPDTVTGGLDTVAIRLPADSIARALIERSGCVIAAPSANLSGKPSPTSAAHCISDLSGRVDMIIDGGGSEIGIESTVVDCTGSAPIVLRPGKISQEMIDKVVEGQVTESKDDEAVSEDYSAATTGCSCEAAVTDAQYCHIGLDTANMPNKELLSTNLPPKSPGMKYRHYSPKGDITIFSGNQEDICRAISLRLENDLRDGKKVALMLSQEVFSQNMPVNDNIARLDMGSIADGYTIAARLFGMLRACDDFGAQKIYTEDFSQTAMGSAIMNRLMKASGKPLFALENIRP